MERRPLQRKEDVETEENINALSEMKEVLNSIKDDIQSMKEMLSKIKKNKP